MRAARCQKVLKRSKGRQRPLCRFVLKPEPCNHPRHPPPIRRTIVWPEKSEKCKRQALFVTADIFSDAGVSVGGHLDFIITLSS